MSPAREGIFPVKAKLLSPHRYVNTAFAFFPKVVNDRTYIGVPGPATR